MLGQDQLFLPGPYFKKHLFSIYVDKVKPQQLFQFFFEDADYIPAEEIRRVEDMVNACIMQNDDVHSQEMAAQEAMESGATALFGEKYGDRVRVVRVGGVSSELCGGTHVRASGDIGLFKIIAETGIAAGVRRIEAQSGTGALAFVRNLEDEQKKIATLVKAEGGNPVEKVERLLSRQKELQREIETLQARLNAAASVDLLSGVQVVNGVKVLAVKVDAADPKALRELSDTLKERLGSGILALGSEIDGKAALLVVVSKELTSRYKAGDIIKRIAPVIGGSGGGRPELAQAGGSDPSRIAEALELVYGMVCSG